MISSPRASSTGLHTRISSASKLCDCSVLKENISEAALHARVRMNKQHEDDHDCVVNKQHEEDRDSIRMSKQYEGAHDRVMMNKQYGDRDQ